MSYKLVIKDAFWQIIGRLFSAAAGFVIIKLIAPYLGDLRFGDYETILAYFAFASSLSDLGLYVLGLKQLGEKIHSKDSPKTKLGLEYFYSQVVWSRLFLIVIVYTVALVLAYLLPAYTENIFLVRGLPLGMFFSGTFMAAGIVQLPLQLYRKMEHVTLSLIFARIGQVLVLALVIFFLFPKESFVAGELPLKAFLSILLSMCVSSIIQFCYTFIAGRRHLKLRWVPFLNFTWSTIKDHWKYGVGFFLSSAPMLSVILILSRTYPTKEGFAYAGIWAFAMKIIVLLLTVVPALGNSLLHKVSSFSLADKKISFGNFLTLMLWAGSLIVLNFVLFAPHIVYLMGDEQFLSAPDVRQQTSLRFQSQDMIGSDVLFVFLSFVLLISFIKQVFTYLLVATHKQNKLFGINLIGFVVGFAFGLFAVQERSLVGGILTQFIFEILFTVGVIGISLKQRIFPKVPWEKLLIMFVFFVGCFFLLQKFVARIPYDHKTLFLASLVGVNIIIIGIWFKFLLNRAKKLTDVIEKKTTL